MSTAPVTNKATNGTGTVAGGVVDAATGTKLEFESVGIARRGVEIIVPEKMSLAEARVWLSRREAEENQKVAVHETIDAFPLEGALALAKALARTFGFTSNVPTPSFFGERPPTMVGVEVAVGRTEQVPLGRIEVPAWEGGYVQTGFETKDGRLIFSFSGEVRQRFKDQVRELAQLTRKIVREESIYRGQAIRVKFPDDVEESSPSDCPTFIDVAGVREEELIFGAEVRRAVNTSLFTPIEHTERCRRFKIPLKRGVLLEGPYGTGKTLTAYVSAKKAVENGWTFIYLSSVSELETAIHFAKNYQPALIFAEDIDRVMDGERDEDMDKILNTIDGVDTKDMELIVCLTTNHVDHIEPAMMRPGRLDAVITVHPPDAKAAIELVRLYARGKLDPNEDMTGVGERLDGQIPAVIREAVERSKLAAVSRMKGGEDLLLRASDLEFAADEMLHHLKLMMPKPEDKRSKLERAADVLGKHLTGAKSPTTAAPRTSNGRSTRDVAAEA